RVLVTVLVGPLPHVAHQVHHPERARALRMRVDVRGHRHLARLALRRHVGGVPVVAPWIEALIGTLRGILPLLLAAQALARPRRVRARILDRYPRDRPFLPALARYALQPVAQEVVVVLRVIAGGLD